MTRRQFIDKAIRATEQRLQIPPGWWGTWNDVTNGHVRVSFTRVGGWAVRVGRDLISRHDSRAFAIRKARGL